MDVPALAWPPGFINQAFKEFCVFSSDATIIVKSPGITTVIRSSTGNYGIRWSREFPAVALPILIDNNQSYFCVSNPIIDDSVKVRVYDTDGIPRNPDLIALFIFSFPDSWVQGP